MLASAFQEMPSTTFVKFWRKMLSYIDTLIENVNSQDYEDVHNEPIIQDLIIIIF